MVAWEVIQAVLDTIEQNLSEDIRIEFLADKASLSTFYFQRLFKKLVRKPVNEYIKVRRLARASNDVAASQRKIGDIAMDYGFSSHANFTRAFTASYGVSPEEYRSHPITLNHFIKPDLRIAHSDIGENMPLITDGIVVEVSRRKQDTPRYFLGFEYELPVTELADGRSVGVSMAGELWRQFHEQKPNIPDL